MNKFWIGSFVSALVFGLSLPALSAQKSAAPECAAVVEEEYDRLDGMGLSQRKVQVIEWEGNLEIHVYPAGSLKGLALKLDKRDKNKPVMVIGYRFDTAPKKQLIRRAILGIEILEGFKVYRDPSSGSEYDKIMISNNGLAGDMLAFALDPEPTQLYPDGHPALAKAQPQCTPTERMPASAPAKRGSARSIDREENGTIKPFFMTD